MLKRGFFSKRTCISLIRICMVLAIVLSFVPQLSVQAAANDLKVSGNKIINTSGQTVRLTGVNIPSLAWSANGEGVGIDSTVKAFDDWQSNVVRIPLNQDFWFGYGANQNDYRSLIDSLVQLAVSRNKYVILDLHWSDMGTWTTSAAQHNMADNNSIQFWNSVATIYKNNPSVLFGLYNEPHDIDWSVWKNGGQVTEGSVNYHTPGYEGLIKTIRDTGAKNIVIAGGNGWANDLTGVSSNVLVDTNTAGTLNGNGIVYDAHIYPWHTDRDSKVLVIKNTYPILIGECGWFDPQWYRDSIDPNWHAEPYTTWSPAMLDWLDNNGLNWTAWSFYPGADPKLINDWNYTPSAEWGAYVKPRLASYNQGGTPTPTPTPGPGSVYEAENGSYGGGATQINESNASGSKVVGTIDNVGAYTQLFGVNGGSGGTATLVIRYSNGNANNRSLSLYVNNNKISQVTFAPTGGWNTFADSAPFTISLNSGYVNNIKIQMDSSNVASAYIDKFTVSLGGGSTPTPTPTPTVTTTRYEGENAQGISSTATWPGGYSGTGMGIKYPVGNITWTKNFNGGTYSFDVRSNDYYGTQTFYIQLDGVDVGGPFTMSAGDKTFKDFTGSLGNVSAGNHTIGLRNSGPSNIYCDYVEVTGP
jgi:hypothetical protein